MLAGILPSIILFFQQHHYILDRLKFVLAGTFFDLSRRLSLVIYNAIEESLRITANIPEDDPAFSWIKYYLIINSTPPTTKTSFFADLRESIWSTGKAPARQMTFVSRRPWTSLTDDQHDDRPYWYTKLDVQHKFDRGIYVYPALTNVQSFRYNGHTLRFVFTEQGEPRMLIETYGRSRTIFSQLLNDARTAFMSTGDGRLSVYQPRVYPGSYGSEWQLSNSRAVRPWDSIILPEGIKEDVLEDVREFMGEQAFYKDRGVPYRRGWLLYGVPGSGKTSLIGALASELQLDIYFINLGSNGIDDTRLQVLFRSAPEKCIVVIEDIDCAMTKTRQRPRKPQAHSSSSSSESDGGSGRSISLAGSAAKPPQKGKHFGMPPRSHVTLSGLLNAIDGVASSEGRLLFCTTNHIKNVDDALIRPGRCDVRVEFKYATKSQAVRLFKHFFSLHTTPVSSTAMAFPTISEKDLMDLPPTPAPTPKIGTQEDNVAEMAEDFGKGIPEGKVSVSAIQGYLMRHKRQPAQALVCLQGWIDSDFGQAPAKTVKGSDKFEKEQSTEMASMSEVAGLGIEAAEDVSS